VVACTQRHVVIALFSRQEGVIVLESRVHGSQRISAPPRAYSFGHQSTRLCSCGNGLKIALGRNGSATFVTTAMHLLFFRVVLFLLLFEIGFKTSLGSFFWSRYLLLLLLLFDALNGLFGFGLHSCFLTKQGQFFHGIKQHGRHLFISRRNFQYIHNGRE